MRKPGRGVVAVAFLLAASLLACSTGEGTGEVWSNRLFIEDCWNGPFNLSPNFFAGQPHLDNTLTIRVQRGDGMAEVSDGLQVVVGDVAGIRQNHLGQRLRVGIPVGVTPPGQPVVADPDPPKVHLALYLQDSCHLQNASVYSLDSAADAEEEEGIIFHSLFSGDPNEDDAGDRLTQAEFTARFGDPRKAIAGSSPPEYPSDAVSLVKGEFRFFFQRGQPAQQFP